MGEAQKITVKIDKDLEAIVPQYLEWSRNDVATMRDALDKGDLDTVRKIGHNLKGSGGGYGFDLVTEIGANIERLAKAGSGEEIKPLIERLKEYFQSVEIVYV